MINIYPYHCIYNPISKTLIIFFISILLKSCGVSYLIKEIDKVIAKDCKANEQWDSQTRTCKASEQWDSQPQSCKAN